MPRARSPPAYCASPWPLIPCAVAHVPINNRISREPESASSIQERTVQQVVSQLVSILITKITYIRQTPVSMCFHCRTQRRGRPIVLTVHNVTTARDLQPHRAGARRRTSHGQLARNNLSTLQGLNAQPGMTVAVRVDTGPPPARLQHTADRAAHSGDLRSMHPADRAPHANAPWDELRVWDPGD